MVSRSRHAFQQTVECLQRAIVEAGSVVFAVLDQAEAATRAGLTLRPTTLLLFGNPRGGTPLMDAYPLFALELPLKLLVWESDGFVSVATPSMTEIAARYAIPADEPHIVAMDALLHRLCNSVATSVEPSATG